jgi:hypothetical protein
MVDKPKVTIQDLYPELSPEEQEEAHRQLQAYLKVVWRIYKRQHNIPDDDPFSKTMDHFFSEDDE